MCKPVSRRGEDWSNGRSPKTLQVRRTIVLNHTINVLLPISGQLDKDKNKIKTIKAMKKTRLARAPHERGGEARHQRGLLRTGGRSLLNEVNDMENGFAWSTVHPNVVAVGEAVGEAMYRDRWIWFGEIGGEGMNFGTGFLQLMSRLELLLRRFLACGSC